jgi:hypothetical protein
MVLDVYVEAKYVNRYMGRTVLVNHLQAYILF